MKQQVIREAAWSLWQEVHAFVELLGDYLDENQSEDETYPYDEDPMTLNCDDVPF
ncbi:MAG: hypothetical protein WCA04_14145 [Geobacteraceae bacterium]